MFSILVHLKTIYFQFGTNGKLLVFGVPVIKHNVAIYRNGCKGA